MSKYTSKQKTDSYMDCPKNLDNHIFYGLVLDEDQKDFRDKIWSNDYDIIFCDSRAGTGKSLISIATANLLYMYGKYDGIVYIVSPTQEEKIGYLPGSPEEKILPYIEPIMKALIKLNINPYSSINQLDEQNKKNGTGFIDCVSHLYLRGDNFDNKVIIIDEAQNMYLDEMKKTLTRINDSCKTIVIGHSGQCDLYKNPFRSGFSIYKEWYRSKERTAICNLLINHRGWVSTHADILDTDAIYTYLNNNKSNKDRIIDLHDFEIK